MRREWKLRVPCNEPGCAHVANYAYDTLRDLESSFELKHKATHMCSRHSNKQRVLTQENKTTEWISEPLRQESYGKFFGSRGLLIGESHYVDAKDFPVGTRIKITCEVLLP